MARVLLSTTNKSRKADVLACSSMSINSGYHSSTWGLKYVTPALLRAGMAKSFRQVVGLQDPPRKTSCLLVGLNLLVSVPFPEGGADTLKQTANLAGRWLMAEKWQLTEEYSFVHVWRDLYNKHKILPRTQENHQFFCLSLYDAPLSPLISYELQCMK